MGRNVNQGIKQKSKNILRSGGIEPPSNAWKASMLTITPRTRTLFDSPRVITLSQGRLIFLFFPQTNLPKKNCLPSSLEPLEPYFWSPVPFSSSLQSRDFSEVEERYFLLFLLPEMDKLVFLL